MKTYIGKDIERAALLLNAGEVVGIPTETVYGLAGNGLNPDAVLKIFTVKNRPHFDPLILHVYSTADLRKYVSDIPKVAEKLMEQFMPGPITLLLKRKAIVPDLVTSGLDTVAIRVPKHVLINQLLGLLDFPLAAPSANPFGYISPTSAQHVMDQLGGKIPYILDGGETSVGLESTIIGFENEQPILYRLGGLALEEIESVVGNLVIANDVGSNPLAPGSLKSHYAPTKKVIVAEYGDLSAHKLEKENAAVICFDKYVIGYDDNKQVLLSAKGNLEEAAKNLFAVMRKLDAGNEDVIYAIKFPELGLGRAINDRLKRASA
jgi:L-threonylcarbamoyladenylate synthase